MLEKHPAPLDSGSPHNPIDPHLPHPVLVAGRVRKNTTPPPQFESDCNKPHCLGDYAVSQKPCHDGPCQSIPDSSLYLASPSASFLQPGTSMPMNSVLSWPPVCRLLHMDMQNASWAWVHISPGLPHTSWNLEWVWAVRESVPSVTAVGLSSHLPSSGIPVTVPDNILAFSPWSPD